jgi:hypothetical protein
MSSFFALVRQILSIDISLETVNNGMIFEKIGFLLDAFSEKTYWKNVMIKKN